MSGIIDIKISGIDKKRYRINGDDNKILELNTSDVNFLPRMNDAYSKLEALSNEAANIKFDTLTDEDIQNNLEKTLEAVNKLSEDLKSIDSKMKELMDYIFDSNVSEICCGNGSMYDPIDGGPRFKVIVDTLVKLYDYDTSDKAKKIQNRMNRHTDKYTQKYSKRTNNRKKHNRK